MKKSLVIFLILVALVMIFISFKAGILAPGLTGLGFIIIAALFYLSPKK